MTAAVRRFSRKHEFGMLFRETHETALFHDRCHLCVVPTLPPIYLQSVEHFLCTCGDVRRDTHFVKGID